MRVGLMMSRGNIAVTFEFARRLLVVDIDGGFEKSRIQRLLGGVSPAARIELLSELGVELVVCGAISRPVSSLVTARGMQLVPLVFGNGERVLAGLFEDRLEDPCFLFPDCSAEDRARLLERRGAVPLCSIGRGRKIEPDGKEWQ